MERVTSKGTSRTRGSVVVGSNPADPTTSRTGAAARIFRILWELKKAGQSEDTLKAKGDRLRHLAKYVNLDDPEAVKGFIADRPGWSNAYRQGVAYDYNSYVLANGLLWDLPHF